MNGDGQLVRDFRATLVLLGPTQATLALQGMEHTVYGLARDMGLVRLDAAVASRGEETGRYATLRLAAEDLPTKPARGNLLTMLGKRWQVRRVQPVGMAGLPALLVLHLVCQEQGRLR